MKSLIRHFLLVRLRLFLRHAPLGWVRGLAFLVALLEFFYHRRARTTIATGLGHDLDRPVAGLQQTVFLSFYHHLLGDFEIVRYPAMTRRDVERHVTFTGPGWDYLRQHPGQAALLCTFHFGPNQLVIPTLPLLGHPFTQLGVPPTEWDKLAPGNRWTREVNRLLTASLEATGAEFIYVSQGLAAMRKLPKAAAAGRLLCVACDGRASDVRSYPFLRGHTELNPGAIGIAARFEIPLIPTFARRTLSGYTIDLYEPILVREGQEDSVANTCVTLLEGYVRTYPQQYGWMYYAKAVGG